MRFYELGESLKFTIIYRRHISCRSKLCSNVSILMSEALTVWANRNHHTTIVNISSLFLCCLKTIDDKLRIPTVLIPSRTQGWARSYPLGLGMFSLTWESSSSLFG